MIGLVDNMPVTLVIKAPNQRMEDHTVECETTWTVKKLKLHLESVYPSKPKLNEQRLIYFGRLLQDHLTLKEILRQYDDSESPNKHTVHLVCSSASDRKSPQTKDNSDKNPTSSPSENTPASSQQSQDGLRHRFPASQPTVTSTTISSTGPDMYSAYQPFTTPQTFPAAGMNGYEYTPEQYAAMMQQQQLYSQYMMQYMQYYQQAVFPYQSFNPQTAAAFYPQAFIQPQPATVGNPPGQAQPGMAAAAGGAQQADAAPPRGAARPAGNNVRMNAQGGVEDDDEDDGEPRDWLHHTYFFMRFLMFMGILFFYSNVTRFLVVFSGSFAIYFLQKIRKYMQRRQREQRRQAEAAAAVERANHPDVHADQNNPEQEQSLPQQQENGETNREEQSQQQQQEGVQPRDGAPAVVNAEGRLTRMFLFACNTVQAFFTSLVPAPPELLDVN